MLLKELLEMKNQADRLERLNKALADMVLGDDEEPLEDEALEQKLKSVAKKYRLNDKELAALRDACDGPIGGPFEKYPVAEGKTEAKLSAQKLLITHQTSSRR